MTPPDTAAPFDLREDCAATGCERCRKVLAREARNALRLPVMSPLREVVETIQHDDVVRTERLSCGHTKTTMTASQRPARRRRCHRCADPLWQVR